LDLGEKGYLRKRKNLKGEAGSNFSFKLKAETDLQW
jgi:hypothetical protein